MLVPEEEPGEEEPEVEPDEEGEPESDELVDVELSPLVSFLAADPSDAPPDDAPARLSVR